MAAYKTPLDEKERISQNRELLEKLWTYNRAIAEILNESVTEAHARDNLYSYFWWLERGYDLREETIHSLEWELARQCLRVAKSIISLRSMRLTEFDLVSLLVKLAEPDVSDETLSEISPGLIIELERLWAGCRARSGIYHGQSAPDFLSLEGYDAAIARGDDLDNMADWMQQGIKRFPTGLDDAVLLKREENKKRILKTLGASSSDWDDWRWHLKHVVTSYEDLARLRSVSPAEEQSLRAIDTNHIPFGITPYYVHLMDPEPDGIHDRAVRYQVIPPIDYVRCMSDGRRKKDVSFDFMQERDTSPVDLVTRRYPLICIMKPYNTCAQICVYCQRNWEIDTCLDPKAMASKKQIDNALNYINEQVTIKEVLVTGGDPLIMSDKRLKDILDRLAAIPHIERIRIGTRTPVVLPMRVTEHLADLLKSYCELGKRDVCIVTHFEHPYEVTPETAEAIDRFRSRGLSVTNQAVFTFANSRRFEMTALRRILRLIGVDPYYTFVTKGKEETNWYRVPIARVRQERHEEARLAPGTWRTDDTIFNVPRLGKNYINRQQDHRIITILPDGRRVFEFHPWEKKMALVDTYIYTDVSIYEYLQRLERDGENAADYSTIWYYF